MYTSSIIIIIYSRTKTFTLCDLLPGPEWFGLLNWIIVCQVMAHQRPASAPTYTYLLAGEGLRLRLGWFCLTVNEQQPRDAEVGDLCFTSERVLFFSKLTQSTTKGASMHKHVSEKSNNKKKVNQKVDAARY